MFQFLRFFSFFGSFFVFLPSDDLQFADEFMALRGLIDSQPLLSWNDLLHNWHVLVYELDLTA